MDGSSSGWKRRLRGAIGNAMVWGIGWGTVGAVGFTALRLTGVISSRVPWIAGVELSLKLGLFGAISGAAFAAVIRFAYRGKRLSQINWLRFGLTAGVATGIFVPLFMQTMNILSGDGLVAWKDVLDDGVMLSVFAAVGAAASLKLAQSVKGTQTADEDDARLDDGDAAGLLGEGTGAARPLAARERATQR